jgi:hypothetical protein
MAAVRCLVACPLMTTATHPLASTGIPVQPWPDAPPFDYGQVITEATEFSRKFYDDVELYPRHVAVIDASTDDDRGRASVKGLSGSVSMVGNPDEVRKICREADPSNHLKLYRDQLLALCGRRGAPGPSAPPEPREPDDDQLW